MVRKFGRARRNNSKKTHHPRRKTMKEKLYAADQDDEKRRACLRKRPLTKTQARSQAAYINTQPSIYEGTSNRPVHAYECPYCPHWHVGRVPRWSRDNLI